MNYKSVKVNGKSAKYIKLNGGLLWQKPQEYEPILPSDTVKFPQRLTGFAVELLSPDRNWGSSSSYKGSVYAKPALEYDAVKLGRAYSNFGNYVTSFSDYAEGDIAIGYSADGGNTKALNIWFDSEKPSAISVFKSWLAENPVTVLYELYESDGSVWDAVRHNGVFGYYNETTNTFVPVYGMDGTVI